MKPVTQSRVGAHGRCFPACVASILEVPEANVPGYEDSPDVYRWLSKRGLEYRQVPIEDGPAPVGYHIIEGISPRGGQHAVVGLDGKIVHDPHPQDGTGRGLVKPERWGMLLPVKSEARDAVQRSKYNVKYTNLRDTVKKLYAEHDAIWNSPIRQKSGEYSATSSDYARMRGMIEQLYRNVTAVKGEFPRSFSAGGNLTNKDARKRAEEYARQGKYGAAISWIDGWLSTLHRIIEDMWEACTGDKPDKAKDSMLSGLALQAAITPVYARHNEIKATPRRSWQEVSKLLGETKALLDASRISDKAKWQTVLAHASSFLAMARDAERQGDNPHFVGWTERAFMMTHHVLDVLESLARRTAARDEANAPYGPGDLIKLPNGKITEVTKCLLGEDLFHEPEYHVSTKTGECVVVPVKARSKDRRAPARLHRALDAVLDGRK